MKGSNLSPNLYPLYFNCWTYLWRTLKLSTASLHINILVTITITIIPILTKRNGISNYINTYLNVIVNWNASSNLKSRYKFQNKRVKNVLIEQTYKRCPWPSSITQNSIYEFTLRAKTEAYFFLFILKYLNITIFNGRQSVLYGRSFTGFLSSEAQIFQTIRCYRTRADKARFSKFPQRTERIGKLFAKLLL